MSLYNCKTDGDQYRISKFTNDLDVEASYLTDGAECDCPAGHRPVCRHRIMLVRFIAKNATAGQWFHNYEYNQWIRAMNDDEPDILGDLASAASEVTNPFDITATEIDERFKNFALTDPAPGEKFVGELVERAINLLELAKPTSGFDCEMQRALKADGKKLRQLTSEDHGPVFLDEPKPLRRL